MVSIDFTRSRATAWAARLAVVALVASFVAACASPGAVTPSPTAAATASAAAPSAPARAPSASAAARAELRDRSGRAERLLRDRVRPAVQALGGVHQAVPERDLGHQAGPVHQPHDRHAATAVGRQSAGPDPAAVDGLAGQGRTAQEPRRLRDRLRLGQVPGGPARPEPRRQRRDARIRLALRGWTQLQPDRRLLQQEARRSRSA